MTEVKQVEPPLVSAPDPNSVVPLAAAGRSAPVRRPGSAPAAPRRQPPTLVPTLDAKAKKAIAKAKQRKLRWVLGSLALLCGLPTLIVGLYMAFFAADQYAASARFAIRGNEAVGSSDLLGLVMGGTGGASNVSDSYIVEEYIHSRAMVDALQERIGVRSIYDSPLADWWMRFPSDSPVEKFLEYWRSVASVVFDSYTGIVTVQVKAFTAADAQKVADGVVAESERLVNELSERARQDTVAFAEREVQFAEDRLREARAKVVRFRDRESTIDPVAIAAAHEKLISELEAQLVAARSDLRQAEAAMGPDAPTVRFHKRRIDAIEAQIADRRSLVASPAGDGATATDPAPGVAPGTDPIGSQVAGAGLSEQVNAYQGLLTDQEFAEKAYVAALASLEQARVEAKQKQRYLATFVKPTLPTLAEYPKRIMDTLIVLVGSLIVWAISMLIVAAIRDHVA